jgi:hypothetical protein
MTLLFLKANKLQYYCAAYGCYFFFARFFLIFLLQVVVLLRFYYLNRRVNNAVVFFTWLLPPPKDSLPGFTVRHISARLLSNIIRRAATGKRLGGPNLLYYLHTPPRS